MMHVYSPLPQKNRPLICPVVLGLILLLCSFGTTSSWAQSPTPGIIFKAATAGTPGSAVLDPNNDGYVSAAATGFTTAAGDLGTQSEIPYKYLPQRTTNEPNADLRVGPSHKFTDFADVNGGGSSVGFYVDANSNYLFRFRLGGSAPNSKGYSIAIDTDNKFGFTGPNADPNAVAHNPGFEMEILLASNFGVRLYNIDGTTTRAGTGPDGSLIELPYASYAHKAIAGTANNGDLDVFYDFYVPLSVIQSAFGSQAFFNSAGTTPVPFSLSTPLRMVANTIIAPHSVTHYQNISDIGGVNDAAFPNPDNAFTELVTGSTPTSGASIAATTGNSIPVRSAAPVVNAPLQTDVTAVSGTSTEAAGTVITVFVDGAELGTTTVQAGGTWTLSGVAALANGALVKAKATATGKSQSDFSNVVQVAGSAVCATSMVAMPTCVDVSGRGIQGNATTGNLIYLRYLDGSLVPTTITNNPITVTNGTYLFTSKGGNSTSCTTGQTNVFKGSYLISQVVGGTGCESVGYKVTCVNAAQTATPVVTTPKPIKPATTSIAGTATADASVLLYVNGVRRSSVTAAGGNFSFTTAAGTLPALVVGEQITITAAVNLTSCESAAVTLNVVVDRTVTAPIVNDPLLVGTTVVGGTSNEASGSTITVTTYTSADGSGTATGTYTTTVQANGTWSVTVPALVAGSVKANVTTTDYGTSAFSDVVRVLTKTSSVPVITGTYAEKGTAVSGTSAAPTGSIISVYEDDDLLGTTTVQAGGTWTLTGLSNGSGISPNTPYPTLYAGGVLTATATESGKLPSDASAPVTVGCATLANKSFTTSPVCQNNAGVFTVSNVEPGVVYTLRDATGTEVSTGTSKTGTGSGTGSLTLSTSAYPTPGTYFIKLNAFSVGASNCSQTTTTSVPLTVNPLPGDKAVGAQNAAVGPNNSGTSITVAASEPGVSYQLLDAATNVAVGTPQTGNSSTLALPTGPISESKTYAVSGTANGCTTRMTQNRTVSYSTVPLPVELVEFVAQANNGAALLTWRTASEKNNDRFEIERSVDGRTFTHIGQVGSRQGTSSQPQAYAFTDAGGAQAGPLVYYRLRQVDTDRTESFSPVRAVQFTATVTARPVLSPNPTTGRVTLNLVLLPSRPYMVAVVNATGQTVRTQELTGGQEHVLDLSALPTGLYVVRLAGAPGQHALRLIKQ